VAGTGRPKGVTNAERNLKKREAQKRVLALRAQGLTRAECMKAVGRTLRTWDQWRQENWFAIQADSIAGRERRPSADKSDFVSFRQNMFGFDTFWHQKEMIHQIEKAKGMEITLILMPPEWMKSTTIEDWMCYVLAVEDPNHHFCVISESATQAKKMLGRVQRRMVDEGSAFYSAYGPFKAEGRDEQKAWNDHACTILQANIDARDFSIEARGAGSKLYGSRYDTVLIDDIQSRQTLNTTQKLFDFIRGDIVTRPGSIGRIVIVGTRVGPGDIYEAMLEAEFIDHYINIPALDEEGRSNFPAVYNEDGTRKISGKTPLGWSEEELAVREHKVGEEIWASVYMQKASSKTGAPFTEDTIRRMCDQGHVIGDVTPGLYTIASMDPALSGYASIKVCTYTYDGLWLIDSENVRAPGRYEELYELVETYTKRWHPSEWVIEGNAMQGGLSRSNQLRQLQEKYGFILTPSFTSGNKFDPQIGVASMADAARRGEIHLPYGDEASKRQLAQLIKELRMWRPDIPTKMLRQDEVMALWFCYHRWQLLRKTLERKSKPIIIGGLPWAQTSLRAANRRPAGVMA
jgi:hypothetical protein